MDHLSENSIAGYLDKRLNPAELRELSGHVRECAGCRQKLKSVITDFEEYRLMLSAAEWQPEPVAKTALKDIAIDFANTAGERVRALFWDISDLLNPATPAVAYRGEGGSPADPGLKVKRLFDRFEVTVAVVRVAPAIADIELTVTDTVRRELPSMRAGLFSGNREMDSVALNNGKAAFTQIGFGDYTLKLWDATGPSLDVTLSMKG